MNPLLKNLLARYMAPAGDDGADTGGTNTGDSDAVVLDDDDLYMARSEEERRRLRGDTATDEPNADTLAALVASGDQSAQQVGQAPDGGGVEPDDATGERSGGGIPRARFNEVNDRRKALEAQVEELQAQLAAGNSGTTPSSVAQTSRIGLQEAEEQYAQLMLDGDAKAAAALRMQINAAVEQETFERFRAANAGEREQAKAQATVEQLLGEFPWLDEPEGAEAMELIEASVTLKMGRGASRAQAISEAVMSIAPRFAPGYPLSRVRQDTPVSGDIRAARANERGAAHSLLQPALPQAGMGNRATPVRVDTSKLSDEEYMALPEAERKKARGD
ncbi:hypothetical protein [Ottowia thiooxydans]|uniref:hypothetical protein n=1 Tax=Ottowia thiooxydans TaxID=219182 RepID=UPI00041EA6A5|nr:hypothetical protein [Ottowia thiooxydans]